MMGGMSRRVLSLARCGLATCALVVSAPALGAGPPVVAVFNIESDGAPQTTRELERLTDYLTARVAEGARFQVVPRAQLKDAMRQKKRESYEACYAESCQIEIGKELAAEQTLAAKLKRFGETCALSLTLHDLRTAASVAAATGRGPCTEEGVLETLEDTADRLLAAAPRPLDRGRRGAGPSLTGTGEGPLSYDDLEAWTREARRREEQEKSQRTAPRLSPDAAWGKVKPFAETRSIDVAARIAAVQRFLWDFRIDNPRREEAEALLGALTSEATTTHLWVSSVPAGIEFTRNEITVEQYRACVEAGACSTAAVSSEHRCNWGKKDRGDHPLNCVTWGGAETFCRWAGGRLPTSEEWEAEAARAGRRTYP